MSRSRSGVHVVVVVVVVVGRASSCRSRGRGRKKQWIVADRNSCGQTKVDKPASLDALLDTDAKLHTH